MLDRNNPFAGSRHIHTFATFLFQTLTNELEKQLTSIVLLNLEIDLLYSLPTITIVIFI